jgi:hypothetical protein
MTVRQKTENRLDFNCDKDYFSWKPGRKAEKGTVTRRRQQATIAACNSMERKKHGRICFGI